MNYVYSTLMSVTTPQASAAAHNNRWPGYSNTPCHMQAGSPNNSSNSHNNHSSSSNNNVSGNDNNHPAVFPSTVILHRASTSIPWGFRLQGGSDYRLQLSVKKTTPGSPSAEHLHCGDVIISINGQMSRTLSHTDASELIKNAGTSLSLEVLKHHLDVPIAKPAGPVKFSPARAAQMCRL